MKLRKKCDNESYHAAKVLKPFGIIKFLREIHKSSRDTKARFLKNIPKRSLSVNLSQASN